MAQLNVIKTLGKFSFIIMRQVSKFIFWGEYVGYRFPHMQPLLTWQEDGVEPATSDVRVNIRDHQYIGVSVNIVYLLTFIYYMFYMK